MSDAAAVPETSQAQLNDIGSYNESRIQLLKQSDLRQAPEGIGIELGQTV